MQWHYIGLILGLATSVTACSSSSSGSNGGGPGRDDGGTPADGKADAIGKADADACPSDQVQVVPCCGGAPVECVPRLDGGACPMDTSLDESSCQSGSPGTRPGGPNAVCMPAPCVPPVPYCAPLPPSCDAQMECNDLCSGGTRSQDGRTVYCLCA
jgi:hypothetical protein